MIKGIGHTAYVVKDMDKSLDFYCNILGFKKAFETRKDNGGPWIIYLMLPNGQFVELFYSSKDANQSTSQIGYSHLAFEVENIFTLADQIKQKGGILDSELKRGKDSNLQFWIKDPDGNRIEFMELEPNSPQMKSRTEK